MQETYARELIEKEKRIDKRKFDEYREIKIEKGIIEKAEGSASIKLGETQIIVGVKINVGTPFPDTPDEGILIVNVEFTPLASPDFESGPPGEDAIELARIVDRGLRESKCIKLDKLVITPGEKVYSVFVDIHIINHYGNLVDASALASIVALLNTKLPKVENDEIVRGEYTGNLPVEFKPITTTICKVGNSFLLDPNFYEESIVESKLSICIRDDDKICALQKQGLKEFAIEEIEKMVDIALKKSKELRKLIY